MNASKFLLESLTLDPSSERAMYLQLAESVMAAIREGRLAPEAPLPGTRTVAERLGVSRNVAIAAYQELLAEGWITCEVSLGTRVAATPPLGVERGQTAVHASAGPSYGFDLPSRLDPLPVAAPSRPVLDLRGGLPDARLLPGADLARAYRRALDQQRPGVRSQPKGDPDLRRCLSQHLEEHRGLVTDPERLVLTSGLMEGLTLLAVAFLRPGERVAVESPGRARAWEVFELAGGQVEALPVDEQGLVAEALEARLAEGPLRLLYLSAVTQHPTGVRLSAERRAQILSLAATHRVAVLEEDCDGDLYYGEGPEPPLAAEDRRGVVIHLGSLAHLVGSSLRLGWVRGPRSLVDRLATLQERGGEPGTSWVMERTLRDLFLDGFVGRMVRRSRLAYRARRDGFAELWRARLPELPLTLPEAGLALWTPLPEGTDALAWSARAAEQGLLVEAGRRFDLQGRNLPFFHVGFGVLDVEEQVDAVARLFAVRP